MEVNNVARLSSFLDGTSLTNNDTHVDGAMAGWIDRVFPVDIYVHSGSIGGPKEKQSLTLKSLN